MFECELSIQWKFIEIFFLVVVVSFDAKQNKWIRERNLVRGMFFPLLIESYTLSENHFLPVELPGESIICSMMHMHVFTLDAE